MMKELIQKDIQSRNERIEFSTIEHLDIQLSIKREDLIHPLVSGNKWRKLKYNVLEALADTERRVITKGGPYSNHIVATAVACHEVGLKSIGIIRGEEERVLNDSLIIAQNHDMELHFVSREDFRKDMEELIDHLQIEEPLYMIPEGGTNDKGVMGCTEILTPIDKHDFDVIACSFGTGGTAAGILESMSQNQVLYVYPALKGEFVQAQILSLLKNPPAHAQSLKVRSGFEFGGYARANEELFEWLTSFYDETGIALDPIYTGKMMYGLIKEIQSGHFLPGTRILAIHTGGLQGISGMEKRYGRVLYEKKGGT